jgi:hypothetical protein
MEPFDWAAHEQRAADLVADLRSVSKLGYYFPSNREARKEWEGRVRAASPQARTSLLLLLIRRFAPESRGQAQELDILWGISGLDPRQCAVTDEEAAWALRTAACLADAYLAGSVLVKVVVMAARATPGTSDQLRAAFGEVAKAVDQASYVSAPARARLRRELLACTLPGERPGEAIDISLIAPGDGWATAVLRELAAWQATPGASARDVNTVLRHLAGASGSKPSKAWLARAGELVRDAGAERVMRLLLQTLTTAHGIRRHLHERHIYGMTYNVLLSDGNVEITRSAAWAASLLDEQWVVPTLQAIAHRGIHTHGQVDWIASDKPANACIYSLGAIASPDAIAALQYLQRTTKHAGYRKRITAALADASRRAGLTPGQLVERVIPTAGLDAGSERHLALAPDITARVRITPDCRVVTEWHDGERHSHEGWVPRVPAGVDAKQYPALRAAVKEVKDAFAGERARLEALLADDRRWDAGEWQDLYLAHPVTGPLARRLLWTIEDAAGAATGLPGGDGTLMTLDGARDIPPAATVQLWHPARAATAQVRGWRDRLVRDEFVQPFKQAFREVYLLTPAERETRQYSNRFAAHILHYQQAFALMKARAWATNYLGPHDGGYEGLARRDFADAGLTAVFGHFAADAAGGWQVDLCSTDRVYFYRTGDRARRPVPVEDVPDLVFTEAMRDVDLFVGVASIALDPNWADRGDAMHADYWNAFSFGELSQTAEIRRDALARIVPKLKIASRLELGDRFLRVHGRLNTYKVHLGSANILIEPDDRYLCIVPGGSGRSSSKVMLPFEGDQVLSVILSKAVLLAADDKITDETILRQLSHRAGTA